MKTEEKQQLIRIRLLGELGKRFGREFQCVARSAADVIRFLSCNFEDFRDYISQPGRNYSVLKVRPTRGYFDFSEAELLDDCLNSEEIFVLCPARIKGSGSFLRIIAGVALIGVSLFVPFLGTTGVLLGASLVLGGIADLLAPQTKTPKEGEKEESYLFDSASGQSRLDLPIPLLFGERIIKNPPVLSSAVDSSLAI